MQAELSVLRVLYIGDGAAADGAPLADTARFRLSVHAGDDPAGWPGSGSIDVIVVDATDGNTTRVRRIRREYPSTPVLAFTGDTDRVESVLDAGATDVVRSSPGAPPTALVRRRVENICETSTVPGTARHGSDTNERLLEHISRNLQDVVWLANPNNPPGKKFEFVSEAYETVWGRPCEHLLDGGMPALYETIHPEDRGRIITSMTVAMESSDFEETFRIVRSDGETRWIHNRALGFEEDGEISRIVGIARDVTERKERESRLERRNDLFSKAQEIAGVGAWEYNLEDPERNRWTDKIYDLFGVPRDTTLTLENVGQYYHPEDWPDVRRTLERAIETGEPFDCEARVLADGDGTTWVHLRGEPQTEDGEVVRVRGTIQDITDRKQRERDLARSRKFLEQIQQVGDVGGWEYDFRTDDLRLTDQTCKHLDLQSGANLTVDEMIEQYHPEDRERVLEAVTGLYQEGEPFDLEVRVVPEDSEPKWVYSHGEPVVEDGEVVAMRGVSRDIHERKQREQHIQAERDLVERILEASPVGILVYDADGEVVRANEGAASMMGVEPETLEGSRTPPEGLEVLSADGERIPQEQKVVERVRRTGEAAHDEDVLLETPAGERRTIVVDAVPLFDDGELRRVVATFDDVTDRVERERKLETRRDELARLDRINSIIRSVDTALVGAGSRAEIEQAVCEQLSDSGRYRHTLVVRASGDDLVVQATCRDETPSLEPDIPATAPTRLAVETGDIHTAGVGDNADADWTICREMCQTVADHADAEMAAIPLTDDSRVYGALVVCTIRSGGFGGRELDVLGELGETAGYAIAAVESREREATLTSLYGATQDLLAAESREAVCEVVVETAASVLEPEAAGIFTFDDQANVLELAAGTDRLREFYGDSTAFGPGREGSITWQTYVTGEQRYVPDVHDSEHLAKPDTDARGALFFPLGEHGVFVVASDQRLSFGEERRRLVGLLAATTEAALDRVVGRANIRERDERLEEWAGRLERLERLFWLVGDIETALRRSGGRAEVEHALCEHVVDTDPYAFAWVGGVSTDEDRIEPRAWSTSEAADEQRYLDDVSLALDGETPAARAVATGEPVSVPNLTDHLRDGTWARAAIERDYQSALAVPLAQEGAVYGVFVVYATAPDAFDGIAGTTFERLGAVVPRVSTSLERDRALLAGSAVELELSLPGATTFLNAVAAAVDCPVRYRDVTPASDGRTHVTFALEDAPVERIRDLEEAFVTVESLDVVERPGETTFRVTFAGPTVGTTLLSCGAIPGEVVARPGETTATVRLPHDADVRLFLDRVGEHYPDVELASRRTVDTGARARTVGRHALAEDLTDRQREVLRTAYESGFFQSPRETTGVELADMLDVSQPTVTHHLREAQRRLFDALFEDE